MVDGIDRDWKASRQRDGSGRAKPLRSHSVVRRRRPGPRWRTFLPYRKDVPSGSGADRHAAPMASIGPVAAYSHSRAGGSPYAPTSWRRPKRQRLWTPACRGMTKFRSTTECRSASSLRLGPAKRRNAAGPSQSSRRAGRVNRPGTTSAPRSHHGRSRHRHRRRPPRPPAPQPPRRCRAPRRAAVRSGAAACRRPPLHPARGRRP